MDQKNFLRVGIIGCGRIASLWDEHLSDSDCSTALPKTHALAFTQNPYTKIVALCDTDITRSASAAKKWNVDFYTNEIEKFLHVELDIICICTPPVGRLDLLKAILAKNSKAVLFMEKPIANNLAEAEEIFKICKNSTILVNYSRRFTPGIQELKNEIQQKIWGELQSGTAYYGNGYMNNGSHMVDLICYLLGKPKTSKAQSIISDDRIEQDFTLSSLLCFDNNAQIQMHGLDHRNYTVFELDLLFQNGRVKLTERAMVIEKQKVIADPVYQGFKVLGKPESSSTNYDYSLKNAVAEIIELSLQVKKNPSCTLKDALDVTEIIENTRRR